MTSGRHSRAENASFSVCPENPDLTPASKIFSVVFDGHFETISEQRRGDQQFAVVSNFFEGKDGFRSKKTAPTIAFHVAH